MKLNVALYEWAGSWDKKPPLAATKALQARFKSEFAKSRPKSMKPSPQMGWRHTAEWQFDVTPEDADALMPPLKKFLAGVPKTKTNGAKIQAELSAAEVKRARFLPLNFQIDVDEEKEVALNPRIELCKTCGYPDFTRVNKPYRVSSDVAKKPKVEVFGTGAGHLMVVRPRVLELLRAVIGDQIESGPAQVVGGRKAEAFWVRPKYTVGPDAKLYIEKRCAACKRPYHAHFNPPVSDRRQYVAVNDWRPMLEHFGERPLDFARVEELIGYPRTGETRLHSYSTRLTISGALATYLRDNGVGGFGTKWWDRDQTCYFSAKGEPAFDAAPRKLGVPDAAADAAKEDRAASLESAREATRALKDLPWDRDGDGYIYFHLGSPNLVVADPMTGSNKGPFKLKGFKPGVHRYPVSAIKRARGENGVDVDSASLVFVDEDFYPAFADTFDWGKWAAGKGLKGRNAYLTRAAEEIGTRFGYCQAPGIDSGYAFDGDGVWTIDVKKVERVE